MKNLKSEYIPFIQNGKQLDNKSFEIFVSLIQNYLKNQDLKINDKIAVITENNLNSALLFHAIINAGYVFVPINPKYPLKLIQKLIDDTNIKLTLISGIYAYLSSQIVLRKSIIIEQLFKQIEEKDNYNKYDRVISKWEEANYSTIIFTSGSSSKAPKGVVHSLKHHILSAKKSNKNIILKNTDRWLITLPIYHIAGVAILMRASQAKATVVFPDSELNIIENIEKYKISHISLVASQLSDLLESKENIKTLKKLNAILVGGSAIPNSLIELAYKNNLNIYTSYGSTEFASQIATSLPGSTLEQLKKSGKPLLDNHLKLSENSELLIKSDTRFYGYYNQSFESEIEKIIQEYNSHNNSWFHTNDIGQIDEEGFLDILGRRDNMFISGGENIQPEEIEKEILKFDYVNNCIVSPLPDKKWGQRPVAFIKISRDYNTKLNWDSFIDKLSKLLPGYSIPDLFLEWEEDNSNISIKNNRKYYNDLAISKNFKILFKKNFHSE